VQVEEALALDAGIAGSVVRALGDDAGVTLVVPDRCGAEGLVLCVVENGRIGEPDRVDSPAATLATSSEDMVTGRSRT